MLKREYALNIDLDSLRKVHFIGITSAFDSFCAEFLLDMGKNVTASEFHQELPEAKEWRDRGILYEGGHSATYITNDLDLVVFPNGPIPGNPECEETEKKGIPAITIGQMLGVISKNFKVIAIAGTHGKTTTSALIVWLLYKGLGIKPNFVIGDKILNWNRSWNYNKDSEYLVVEACEYKKQFLDRAHNPYIAVLTNVELDHTDYYHSQEEYNHAFSEFISNSKNVVTDLEGINIKEVLENSNRNFNVLDVNNIKEKYSSLKLPLIGEYNRENMLRACGVSEILNIQPFFDDFPGVESRFEYKGTTPNGMKVFLDYAHNPKKVSSCLRGARDEYTDKKIIFVWEPHSYERTYSFKEEFAESIKDADIVMIPDIFAPLREKKDYENKITAESFTEYLKEKNPHIEIIYTQTFEKTSKLLLSEKYTDEYICILASAGNLKDILPSLNLKK